MLYGFIVVNDQKPVFDRKTKMWHERIGGWGVSPTGKSFRFVRAGEAKLREAARRRCFRGWVFSLQTCSGGGAGVGVPFDPVFGAFVLLAWVFVRMFN